MVSDKNPDYKKIYSFVCDKFNNTKFFCHGPFDETYFTLRVYETAKDIIKFINTSVKTPIKTEQVLVAALLHDVGKIKLRPRKIFKKDGIKKNFRKEWIRHPKLSVPIAKKYLKEENYSEQFIEEVCYLIQNHDQRADKMDSRTIELEILQDADLIADCGFAGFMRPFLFGGKFKRSMSHTINYIKNETNRVDKGNMLNLQISKDLAKEEMQIQNNLISELSKDFDSDLLD